MNTQSTLAMFSKRWLSLCLLAAVGATGIVAVASGCAESNDLVGNDKDANEGVIQETDAGTDAVADADVDTGIVADAGCDAGDSRCNVKIITCADTEWCPTVSNIEVRLSLAAIWGSAASDVWAVGSSGAMAHYDGTKWNSEPPLTPYTLRAITGTSATDIWAVSAPSVVFHRTLDDAGAPAWQAATPIATGATTNSVLTRAVWAGGDDVVAVGDTLSVRVGFSTTYVQQWQTKSSPVAWTRLPGVTGLSLYGAWGTSPADLWTVGNITARGGVALKRAVSTDGGVPGWIETDVQTSNGLTAIWGSTPNDVWTVGLLGTIRHFNGTSWEVVESPVSQDLNAVWGAGPNDVWAVGDFGTMIHWDGTRWKETTAAWPVGVKPHLYGVWGSGANDVWAVGQEGTILHFEGKFVDGGAQ